MSDKTVLNTAAPRPPIYLQDMITEEREAQMREYVKALVYGFFGTGKTKFGGTFPAPFLIDFDKGFRTILPEEGGEPLKGVFFKRGDRFFKRLNALCLDIRNRTGAFAEGGEWGDRKSIIFDGYTAFANSCMYETVKFDSGQDPLVYRPQYDEYSRLYNKMEEITGLLQDAPFNVLFTANADWDKDEATGSTVGKIDILGSFRTDVGRRFDEVYYLEKKRTAQGVAYLAHLRFHPKFAVKSRTKGTPDTIEDPTFEKLYSGGFVRS